MLEDDTFGGRFKTETLLMKLDRRASSSSLNNMALSDGVTFFMASIVDFQLVHCESLFGKLYLVLSW